MGDPCRHPIRFGICRQCVLYNPLVPGPATNAGSYSQDTGTADHLDLNWIALLHYERGVRLGRSFPCRKQGVVNSAHTNQGRNKPEMSVIIKLYVNLYKLINIFIPLAYQINDE